MGNCPFVPKVPIAVGGLFPRNPESYKSSLTWVCSLKEIDSVGLSKQLKLKRRELPIIQKNANDELRQQDIHQK